VVVHVAEGGLGIVDADLPRLRLEDRNGRVITDIDTLYYNEAVQTVGPLRALWSTAEG
jgi:hypothetical protein